MESSDKSPIISCVIAAYNEATRIEPVLEAVLKNRLINEVIVVNDGSNDNTEALLRDRPGLILISYPKNRGKSHAVRLGIEQAKGDFILMIDADLIGLTDDNLTSLISPILENKADSSMSLRKNSLLIYKLFGLDFFSGERIFRKNIITDLNRLDNIPGYGLESLINQIIVKNKLRIESVYWPNLSITKKSDKIGLWAGIIGDIKMTFEIIDLLGPVGLVKMVWGMMRLKTR